MSTIRTRLSVPGAGGPLRAAIVVVGVLALVASAAAVWFGVAWYRAAHDDSIALAQTREQVLRDARQAAINLNTMDHTRLDESLDLLQQSTTGTTLDDLKENRESYAEALTAARTSSTATVLDAAVADLNAAAGTAQALLAVDVSYRPEEGEASCLRNRMQLQMKRVQDTWKVEDLGQVGAGTPVPGGACPAPAPDDDPPN